MHIDELFDEPFLCLFGTHHTLIADLESKLGVISNRNPNKEASTQAYLLDSIGINMTTQTGRMYGLTAALHPSHTTFLIASFLTHGLYTDPRRNPAS